jgi:hypothetical protein
MNRKLLFPYTGKWIWIFYAVIIWFASSAEAFFSKMFNSYLAEKSDNIFFVIFEVTIGGFVLGFFWGIMIRFVIPRVMKFWLPLAFHFFMFPLFYLGVISTLFFPLIVNKYEIEPLLGLVAIPLVWGMRQASGNYLKSKVANDRYDFSDTDDLFK